MNHRFAISWALIVPLLLSACAGLPPATEQPGSLATEVCDVTRQRLAAAQPGTPETEALAIRIETDCERLGQDYATALRDSALRGATASVPDLRSPHDPGSVVRQGDKVRVALWTNQDTAEQYYAGNTGTTPPDKPVVWVTLAPEIQQWCSGLDWSGAPPGELAADYQRISHHSGLGCRLIPSMIASSRCGWNPSGCCVLARIRVPTAVPAVPPCPIPSRCRT